MTATIINKTPHPVNMLDAENRIIKIFPKSTGMIRVPETQETIGELQGIPITSTKWGQTTDVPEPMKGIFYIVSQLVRTAYPYRTDLLVPKQVVRDSDSNILGCKCLDVGNNPELFYNNF